ncbi:MAG: NAD(P)H-hydrate dehydratase [Pseudomonadota bacterium]
MTELLTAAQMRALEQAAIDAGEVTGLELMERAGRGTVEAIFDWRPELAEGRRCAVVFCGPGNNGGDGFVVARLLHARGWRVEVYLYGRAPDEIDTLTADAAINAQRWAMLGEIHPTSDWPGENEPNADIYIDALFGTGLSRPLSGEAVRVIEALFPVSSDDLVCLDIPSGICADSGRLLIEGETGLFASLTVTYHAAKLGHYLAGGPVHCARLRRIDIGLDPHKAWRRLGLLSDRARGTKRGPSAVVRLTIHNDYARERRGYVPLMKDTNEHKYVHGHALILSGGVGRGGAARLAARGALRIGAGLVTVGCPPAALIENACQLNAIMVQSLADPQALVALLQDERLNALCLGPGLGVSARTRALVEAACKAKRATVLDADALTAFADDPEALFALLHPECILTPHEGEFKRLFPDILAKLKAPATKGPAYSKIDATRAAAKRAGCTVLLKGADTVIANETGKAAINAAHYARAAPWLATAGSGDVLAGFITGLLARGLPPMEAAESAAWLHVECARQFGPGLIAEDLPEALPGVFRALDL